MAKASTLLQAAIAVLVGLAVGLVLVAVIFPWYMAQAGDSDLNTRVSLHPVYAYYSCHGSSSLCDNVCTGLHDWGTLHDKKCSKPDKVYDGNTRTLLIFTWIFDIVALPFLFVLLAMYVPKIGDQIMSKLPPKIRGLGPIAVAAIALFWLTLAWAVFWLLYTTAQCNDLTNAYKDTPLNPNCDSIKFIDDDNGTKVGPTWGWATTVSAWGLMVFAIGGMVGHMIVQKKESGGEYTPMGGGGTRYT